MAINATILASEYGLEDANASIMLGRLAERVKQNRLELNLTQKALAARSGVSFASLRRFENTGEISLKSLILIAIALDAAEGFSELFSRKQYQSIDQLLAEKAVKTKKRGRKNELAARYRSKTPPTDSRQTRHDSRLRLRLRIRRRLSSKRSVYITILFAP